MTRMIESMFKYHIRGRICSRNSQHPQHLKKRQPNLVKYPVPKDRYPPNNIAPSKQICAVTSPSHLKINLSPILTVLTNNCNFDFCHFYFSKYNSGTILIHLYLNSWRFLKPSTAFPPAKTPVWSKCISVTKLEWSNSQATAYPWCTMAKGSPRSIFTAVKVPPFSMSVTWDN